MRRDPWLGVIQGNSHHRWGWFDGLMLQTVQIYASQDCPPLPVRGELWLAAVVPMPRIPAQARVLTLQDIPLAQTYATLGLDRALGLWTAGVTWGWPMVVVDAGTALTITAGTTEGLQGGAILPGWGSQARSLRDYTTALPLVAPASPSAELHRWATDTPAAIRSGLTYGLQAVIRDFWQAWQADYPDSGWVITGGDAPWLVPGLGIPDLVHAPDLLLQGLAACRHEARVRGNAQDNLGERS